MTTHKPVLCVSNTRCMLQEHFGTSNSCQVATKLIEAVNCKASCSQEADCNLNRFETCSIVSLGLLHVLCSMQSSFSIRGSLWPTCGTYAALKSIPLLSRVESIVATIWCFADVPDSFWNLCKPAIWCAKCAAEFFLQVLSEALMTSFLSAMVCAKDHNRLVLRSCPLDRPEDCLIRDAASHCTVYCMSGADC